MLGSARQVKVTRKTPSSSKAPATKEEIKARIANIKAQIEETTSDYDRKSSRSAWPRLAGGVAVIKVGAATEIEMKEKKAPIEDALAATRAAVEEGIVPGGGVALLNVIWPKCRRRLPSTPATPRPA